MIPVTAIDRGQREVNGAGVSAAPKPAGQGPTIRPPDDAQEPGELPAAAIATALIAVPVEKVRFLQAMAEDGAGARPCRIAGFPLQRVIQRTLC